MSEDLKPNPFPIPSLFSENFYYRDSEIAGPAGPAGHADLLCCRTECPGHFCWPFTFVLFSVQLIFIRSGYIPTVQDRMSDIASGVFRASGSAQQKSYQLVEVLPIILCHQSECTQHSPTKTIKTSEIIVGVVSYCDTCMIFWALTVKNWDKYRRIK